MQESEGVHEEALRVSCISCERLHPVKEALAFNPVCPICTGKPLMRSLDMNGSYPLTDEMIDEMVTRRSPGNYALGYEDGTAFLVFYVGRADSDLNHRLHDWAGAPSRYTRHAPSGKAAFRSRRRRAGPLGIPTLDRVGIGVDSSYTRFAFSYAPSARAAFDKECRNYHDFGRSDDLDNRGHPKSPAGSRWQCAVDGQ